METPAKLTSAEVVAPANLELANVLDVPAVQYLLDDFYKLVAVPMAVLDLKGRVLVGVGWQDACLRFHRVNSQTCRHCIESDTELSVGVPQGAWRLYKCKNNMWDVATPIVVGGQPVGNVFLGQFFFDDEPLDYELFRAQAKQYGFDEKEYLAALERVPRLSRAMLNDAMSFFMKLADLLSQLSYSNSRLAQSLADRQQMTQTLQRYELLAGEGRDIILFVHRDDGRLLEVNAAAVRAYGYSREELLERTVMDLRVPEQRNLVASQMEEAEARGLLFETIHQRKDGSRFHVEVSSRGADFQGVRTLVSVVRDVSERKSAEERLLAAMAATEQAKARAEQANAAKGRFLANVSHELRTPMNAILGMVELAAAQTTEPRVHEFLNTAKHSADLLLTLLNDLLDSSKIESGKLELESAPFSVRQVFERVMALLEPRAKEKELAFTFSILPDVPDILLGDQVRLRQILINLVGNAIKFTEKGGVQLAVERVDAEEGIACLRVTLRDTGIGIAPADLERIFQPFGQADSSPSRHFGGAGLGLSISKSLIGMMGGKIEVESEVGRGSTFRFSLRLPLATQRGPAHSGRANRPPPARALRILLAEDNLGNQKVATYLLETRGHQVEVAADGRQAVQLATQRAYDVILMDLQMPGMDGLEATAAIRAVQTGKPRTPIIAVTAHAMKGDRERCLAAGMDGYLSKPIDCDELIAVVEGDPTSSTNGNRLSISGEADQWVIFNPGLALRHCLGDVDVLIEMAECFLNDVYELFPQMHAALQESNWAKLASLAHRLKGSLLYLGASSATESAAELENLCHGPALPARLAESLAVLEQRCDLLKEELIAYRSIS